MGQIPSFIDYFTNNSKLKELQLNYNTLYINYQNLKDFSDKKVQTSYNKRMKLTKKFNEQEQKYNELNKKYEKLNKKRKRKDETLYTQNMFLIKKDKKKFVKRKRIDKGSGKKYERNQFDFDQYEREPDTDLQFMSKKSINEWKEDENTYQIFKEKEKVNYSINKLQGYEDDGFVVNDDEIY